jgi:hypothetical protein
MMNAVRLLAAAVTLLLLLPLDAAAQRQVTIVIAKPALVRNVQAASVAPVYNAVAGKIRELFPCARVLTDDDRAVILNRDRERVVMGGDAENSNNTIADMAWADYVITMEFGSNGTTNNNPERYMTTTMFDLNRSRAGARNTSSEPGWTWAPGDFVEETVAPFRALAYEVCPWLGTITYTRTANESADSSEKSTEMQMGGTTAGVTRTTKVAKHEEASFTFTLTRGRVRGVRIQTTGAATMKSESEQRLVTVNKTCFPQDAAGAVRDTGLVSGVSDALVERQTASGEAKAPLLSAKVVPVPVEGTWTISVEGMAIGESQNESASERSGGCGAWSKVDPAASGPGPFGLLVNFVIDNLREIKGELNGKQVLSAGGGEHVDVVFRLTRK